MKTSLLIALSALLVPAVSEAARPWLLPSQTVLARSGGWVAVDAAMADDLFSVNQGAMPVDTLVVSGPDGQPVAPQNVTKSRSRSTFDLELRQAGTYRIAVADDAVTARWEEDGKPKRWRGTAAEMAAGIPANAAKLEVEQTQRRVETFVSVGTPTEVKPSVGRRYRARADTASQRSLRARNREVSLPAGRQAGEGSGRRSHCGRHAISRRARRDDVQDRQERRSRHHLAGCRHVLAGSLGAGRGSDRARRQEAPRELCRHVRSAHTVV